MGVVLMSKRELNRIDDLARSMPSADDLGEKSQLMAALLFLLVLAVQRDFLRLQIGDHTFDPVNRELVIDRG
jgi:hypothetical protein